MSKNIRPAGVDRGGQLGPERLGGDHVAPDGQDASPEPRDEAAIGRAVGRHHDLGAPQVAPRRLELISRSVTRDRQDGGGALQHRTRRRSGPGQTGRQLGGVEPSTALDEQASIKPSGADLLPELVGIEEPGLLVDGGVGSRHGALVPRHPGMMGQLHVAVTPPVEFDAELGGEGVQPFEGGHGLVPEPTTRGLGQKLRHMALASGMGHAPVAAAGPGPDVVTIQDDDVPSTPGDLERGGQARVPTSHHDDVGRRRQRGRGRLGQVHAVPPVGPRLVSRTQRCEATHGAIRPQRRSS